MNSNQTVITFPLGLGQLQLDYDMSVVQSNVREVSGLITDYIVKMIFVFGAFAFALGQQYRRQSQTFVINQSQILLISGQNQFEIQTQRLLSYTLTQLKSLRVKVLAKINHA